MNRQYNEYIGQVLFCAVAVLALANIACTTYTPLAQRTMSVPLSPPPSISPKRASLQLLSTVATAAAGDLGDSYISPHTLGLGGAARVTRFLSVRLNGFVALGPTPGATTAPRPSEPPLMVGPGVVFQSPMLAHRVELFGAFDLGVAIVPTEGIACRYSGLFGDETCTNDDWLSFSAQLSLELGLRVWFVRGTLAAHLAGTVINQPHLDTARERKSLWAGVTRLHLQWLATPNIEFIVGGGTRFTSGPAYYGSSDVGLQLDAAIRIHFANAL